MLTFTIVDNQETWNTALGTLDGGQLLQSWQWGELKSKYGWKPARILWIDDSQTPIAAAQLLYRTTTGNLTIAYCPRGPILNWDDPVLYSQVLSDLADHASQQGAIYVKMDPEIPIEKGLEIQGQDKANLLRESWLDLGWRESQEQIQFRNTFILKLEADEETLLANMKQKTRYNVRLSGRRGVVIRRGDLEDLDLLYQLYAETSIRDGFVIRDPAYYAGCSHHHLPLWKDRILPLRHVSRSPPRQNAQSPTPVGGNPLGKRSGLPDLRLLGCTGSRRPRRSHVWGVPIQRRLWCAVRSNNWRVGFPDQITSIPTLQKPTAEHPLRDAFIRAGAYTRASGSLN